MRLCVWNYNELCWLSLRYICSGSWSDRMTYRICHRVRQKPLYHLLQCEMIRLLQPETPLDTRQVAGLSSLVTTHRAPRRPASAANILTYCYFASKLTDDWRAFLPCGRKTADIGWRMCGGVEKLELSYDEFLCYGHWRESSVLQWNIVSTDIRF